jgi:hypothetical protein
VQGRDIFGALLRVLGLWFLIQACGDRIFIALRLKGGLGNLTNQVAADKIFVGFDLLLAYVLLVAADKIVKLIYGSAK